MEKFPDHVDAVSSLRANGAGSKRQSRREQNDNGHSRQKSFGDAIRTIRTRQGSVSQNVHEITDALKAPVSPRLVVGSLFFSLCNENYCIGNEICIGE